MTLIKRRSSTWLHGRSACIPAIVIALQPNARKLSIPLGRFDTVFRIRDRHGKLRFIQAHATVHTDDSAPPSASSGWNKDITERYESEQKLSLAASVFDHARDGIIITDAERRIIDVNPAFTAVTGYSREEVLGKNPALLRSGRHDEDFYRKMWAQIDATGSWRGEIWNRRKSGELFVQMETISTITDPQRKRLPLHCGVLDITRLIEQQEKLERMAHFDALTGLPNRVLLADRIEACDGSARRNRTWLAVCYLDLDGFKPVNDHFGHAAGDSLLVELPTDCGACCVKATAWRALAATIRDPARRNRRFPSCEKALERLLAGLTDDYVVAGTRHLEDLGQRRRDALSTTMSTPTPCCDTPTTPCTWQRKAAGPLIIFDSKTATCNSAARPWRIAARCATKS